MHKNPWKNLNVGRKKSVKFRVPVKFGGTHVLTDWSMAHAHFEFLVSEAV